VCETHLGNHDTILLLEASPTAREFFAWQALQSGLLFVRAADEAPEKPRKWQSLHHQLNFLPASLLSPLLSVSMMVCRLLPQSKDATRGSALNAGFRKVANLPAFTRLYTYAAFELLNSTSWHPHKV
jgi:hypothetical protein